MEELHRARRAAAHAQEQQWRAGVRAGRRRDLFLATIDPKRNVLYVATGASTTSPEQSLTDAIAAFDISGGKLRWVKQLSRAGELASSSFTAAPVLRTLATGNEVLLAAQKSGVVYALDPDHGGEVLWQTRTGAGNAHRAAASPGASPRITRASMSPDSGALAQPANTSGALSALDLKTGDGALAIPRRRTTRLCSDARRAECSHAQSQAVTVMPGAAFSGSLDGHLRAYSTINGKILWDFDTAKAYQTVNGVNAAGGPWITAARPSSTALCTSIPATHCWHSPWTENKEVIVFMASNKRFVGWDLFCRPASRWLRGRPNRRRRRALENSVVKVFSTMRYPDPFKPWTKQAPSEATGSGVVIEGRRILTNAHVVLYASQVQVQANAAGDKISATVEAVAPGIDLAVLKLDDPSFFDTHPAVARASKLPHIKDAVLAYGFPTGGTSLSITKGIVSRIEFVSYNYPTFGPAHPNRCGHQSRQQRRPGDRGRQDDRPGVQPTGTATPRTSATSFRTKRSSCSWPTSPTATTTASPACTTICRRSRIRRCAIF